jgi:hypothetical protein
MYLLDMIQSCTKKIKLDYYINLCWLFLLKQYLFYIILA